MWRDYSKGSREFCGIALPDGLQRDSKLAELLITPSTKGVLTGIDGVPEVDDVNVSRAIVEANHTAFGFDSVEDIGTYEKLLREGFGAISEALASLGQIFVDTKFEFGYVTDARGVRKLIYMDEVGTPDSSRIWDGEAYASGRVVEKSKEGFRKALQAHFPDPDILLNKDRMDERYALAANNELPAEILDAVSQTYVELAQTITGETLAVSADPRAEILAVLDEELGVVVRKAAKP
jgi:phosphoribosylaminoimidazole-succinocarboxamide synthase